MTGRAMTPAEVAALALVPSDPMIDAACHALRLCNEESYADAVDARIAALEARVKELEAGLRPFAGAIQGNYFHQNDDLRISCGHGKDDLRWVLPLGDWRRARALLGDKP
jgi:hypothetical protein